MATVFTAVWRIELRINSLVNNELYYIEFPVGTLKQAATDMAKELTALGYVKVRVRLLNSLP